MSKNYVRRGQWYYYFRRVPKHVAAYDQRKHVRIALRTKVEKEAIRLAAINDEVIEDYWAGLVRANRIDVDQSEFQKACEIAKAHGFAYKNLASIVSSSLGGVVDRVDAAYGKSPMVVKSLLGNVTESSLPLSATMKVYWPLCVDRFTNKTEHQIRKYKNPRELAMSNFIEAVGDMQLHEVTRSTILDFRNWWLDRIAKNEVSGHTANKRMSQVKDILITVGMESQLSVDFKLMFTDTRLKEHLSSRPPFEARYIQDVLIDALSLEEMNMEARMLAYMMMDTGARESELIGLISDDVFLDAPVPYLWIRENSRRSLKTKSSDRKIPLVGTSLWAASMVFPRGFTRYHDNPDMASTEINKYLRERDLKPTAKHSLYSLRHTFKDRLRDIGAPGEVIDELMGHAKFGVQYGRGHTLETKRKWLQRIAFKLPLMLQKNARNNTGI